LGKIKEEVERTTARDETDTAKRQQAMDQLGKLVTLFETEVEAKPKRKGSQFVKYGLLALKGAMAMTQIIIGIAKGDTNAVCSGTADMMFLTSSKKSVETASN